MATNTARPFLDVPHRPMTAADLAALPTYLPSGDFDYELDNGRLVILDPADAMHGAVHANLLAVLLGQVSNRGRVLSGAGVIIRRQPDCVYGPDIVFISNSSSQVRTSPEDYLESIPDLIGEVRSLRDSLPYLQRKLEDYLSARARLVWLVEPQASTVTVFRPGMKPQLLTQSDTLTAEGVIPGFSYPLANLFHDND